MNGWRDGKRKHESLIFLHGMGGKGGGKKGIVLLANGIEDTEGGKEKGSGGVLDGCYCDGIDGEGSLPTSYRE